MLRVETNFEKTPLQGSVWYRSQRGEDTMNQEARNGTTARDLDWKGVVVVLALPVAIAVVSFGCQFFL